MKKIILTVIAVMLLGGLNGGAFAMQLKFVCHTTANDDFDRLVIQPFLAGISQATGGQVTFQNYFSQTLLKYDDVWDGLAEGRADLGLIISSFYEKRTPLSNVMDLPTLPFTKAAVHAAAMWRLYESFPEMQAEYQTKGIRPLMFITTGQEYLFTSKPVAKLEDLKDIYLISDSPITVKQFEFFDSADMHQAQLYEIFNLTNLPAFGLTAPAENFIIWNLAGYTPYATVAPLSFTYIVIAISEKKWQELSEDLQAQIMDACGEAASRRYSGAYAKYFADLINTAGKAPTFIMLTDEERERWIYLNEPLVAEWQAACAKLGLGDVAAKIYTELGASVPQTP